MSVEGCEVMVGAVGVVAALTSSTALLLVTDPALLVTTTEKLPALSSATAGKVSTALVAPAMFTPSRRHWNVKGPVPSTPTAKVAVLPTFAVTRDGLGDDAGSDSRGSAWVTLSTAELLVALPALLVTRTRVTARVRAGDTVESQHRAVGARDVRAVEAPLVTQRFCAMGHDGEHGITARGHAERGWLRRDARRDVEIAHGNRHGRARGAAHGIGGDHAVLLAVVRRNSRRGGVARCRGAGADGDVGPFTRGIGGARLPLQAWARAGRRPPPRS